MSGASANLLRHVNQLVESQRLVPLSDRQLLQCFATERDQAAFTLLVRRHGSMVFGVCRRLLGHEQEAEDAFQAVFLILARKAGSIRQNDVGGFLYRVAYRLAVRARLADAKRRKQVGAACRAALDNPACPAALASPARQAGPTDLMWREVQTVVDEELSRLPESLRAAIILCDLESQTLAEAAHRLGCSKSTLYRRLNRGRKILRQRLTKRGLAPMASLAALLFIEGNASAALVDVTVRSALHAAPLAPAIAALVQSGSVAFSVSRMKTATLLLLIVLTGGSLIGWYGWASDPSATGTEPPAPHPAIQPNAKASIDLRGRVLGPDGKPIHGARLFMARGARVYLPRQTTTWSPNKETLALSPVGHTDSEGRFRIAIRGPDRGEHYYVLAYAAGFGVDWITRGDDERTEEVTFRLPQDVPITGRLISTEGRPFVGVSVSVIAVFAPANDKLDDYLSGWLRDMSRNLPPDKRTHVPLDGISGAVKTDKDGRFTLHGVGRERLVYLLLSGGGVARTKLHVITRPGFDPARYNAVFRERNYEYLRTMNRHFGLHPPSFTFVVEPGRIAEGKITDAASGKAVAGFRVSAHTGYSDWITVLTDAEGKYRFDGLPNFTKGIRIRPPEGSDYLGRYASWSQSVGSRLGQIHPDVAVAKGAVIVGRVVDKQSGKLVPSYIRPVSLRDNKFRSARGGYQSHEAEGVQSDKDGRFRLVAIPGQTILMAQVSKDENYHGKRLSVYRKAVPDPDQKDRFTYDSNGDFWVVDTVGGLEFLHNVNAVKILDVKEKGETSVELSVDHGKTSRIEVQDADGKPLAGAWAAGLTDTWPITYRLHEATATIFALNPDKPRTMAFLHVEKKLGGTVIVRGDEKEPVVVRLGPLGQVSGRLLDMDGNPVEGVEVSINPRKSVGDELDHVAVLPGKKMRTGKDGRFRLANILPNLQFGLNLRRERTFFVSEPRLGVKQVKPGESLDLGDVRVKPR